MSRPAIIKALPLIREAVPGWPELSQWAHSRARSTRHLAVKWKGKNPNQGKGIWFLRRLGPGASDGSILPEEAFRLLVQVLEVPPESVLEIQRFISFEWKAEVAVEIAPEATSYLVDRLGATYGIFKDNSTPYVLSPANTYPDQVYISFGIEIVGFDKSGKWMEELQDAIASAGMDLVKHYDENQQPIYSSGYFTTITPITIHPIPAKFRVTFQAALNYDVFAPDIFLRKIEFTFKGTRSYILFLPDCSFCGNEGHAICPVKGYV